MSTVSQEAKTDVKNAETVAEPIADAAQPPEKSIEDRFFAKASPEKEEEPVEALASPPEPEVKPENEAAKRRTTKRFQELVEQNSELKMELRAQKTAKPINTSDEPKGPDPERDQFKTWDDFWAAERQYRKDYAAWAVKKDRAEQETEIQKARQAEKDAAITKEWNIKAAKTMERHPEFRMLVQESDAHPIKAELLEQISDAASEFIASSEVGPDILFMYAEDSKKLAALHSMTAAVQVREVKKMEDFIIAESAPAKKLTKAPPPSTPVKGGNAGVAPDKAIEDRFYK